MPKMKTNKSAARRFSLTKSGKVRKHKPGHSHKLTKKSRKHKRELKQVEMMAANDEKRLKKLLPYGRP